MAEIISNLSGQEDSNAGWKTYYLHITTKEGDFYKIGCCTGSVAKRYSKESKDVVIEILKLWIHKSEDAAIIHENRLLKDNRGDMPFIGRCGPLRHGGNTETYSHNVLGGESPPVSYIVRMHSMKYGRLYAKAYPYENPRDPYSFLHGQVKYMDYSFGPEEVDEGGYLQVPALSHEKSVTIATEEMLMAIVERGYQGIPKRHAKDALEGQIRIYCWSDYSRMLFEGKEFSGRNGDWV